MAKIGKKIKVGKNQIYKDYDVWVVEIFEYSQNGVPMYSVFDAFKNKKQAINAARIINKNNQNRIRYKLMVNPNYFA